jgi:hypothetical protein
MASAETAARTACARRSPPARSCPAPPCWCSASTYRRPTPPTCSRTLRARSATCSRTGSPRSRSSWTPGPGRPRRDGARPQVIAQLLAGQRRDSALAALTGRERQLLALMAEGHANHGHRAAAGDLRQRGGNAQRSTRPPAPAPPAGVTTGAPRPPARHPSPRIHNQAQEPRRAVASDTPKTRARRVPPRMPSSYRGRQIP